MNASVDTTLKNQRRSLFWQRVSDARSCNESTLQRAST